jgi:hypothetical protein
MSRVTLAFGSFLLGLCVMYLFGSHTSTIVQRVLAQETHKPPITQFGIVIENAEPRLPPLGPFMQRGLLGSKVRFQQLDGLNCDGCVITAEALTYAGGVYSCPRCKLTVDRVELRGAALNTLTFLMQVGVVGQPATPSTPKGEPFNPNAPNVKIAEDKSSTSLMLVSAIH